MKRKAEDPAVTAVTDESPQKKRALSEHDVKADFRKGLFDNSTLSDYTQQYANSEP